MVKRSETKSRSCLVLLTVAAMTGSTASFAADEVGYPKGALALSAIERGDWASAERQIGRGDDPAMLINLGEVYWRTGRPAEAAQVWRKALRARTHFLVRTRDGRIVRTDDLARQALSRTMVLAQR